MGHFLLIFCTLFFSVNAAAEMPIELPESLSILTKESESFEDVERLVRYRWFESGMKNLETYPQEDEKVRLLKSRALIGLKRYSEAHSLLDLLLRETENPKTENEALRLKARTLTRLKLYPESFQTYQKLARTTAHLRDQRHLIWAAFKTALEGKLYHKGLQVLEGLQEGGSDILWWRGWCHFRLKEYQSALKFWGRISKKSGRGYYPQAQYWSAVLQEELGNYKKSETLLDHLIQDYPVHYYGFLAVFKRYSQIADQQKIISKNWTFSAGDQKHRKFPQDREGEVRTFWEEKYPLPHFDLIKPLSRKHHLDPYLVFGLMRQESHFREEEISPSGAIGLMQLMPTTALRLSQYAVKDNFQLVHLFEPESNIRLGTFYLGFLKNLFKGREPTLLAAYNAGEEAVSRWLLLRESEPSEYFIEEIPFSETQEYTKRVLQNIWIYHWLYNGSLPKWD